jgi:hypothetical protein
MADIQHVTFPWEANADDQVVANCAIGSLRASIPGWLTTKRGIHAETLLVSLGAVAGFAAQHAMWIRVRKRDLPGSNVQAMNTDQLVDYLESQGLLVVIRSKSGEKLYLGDLINGYLAPSRTASTFTLWSFVAAAAVESGAKITDLPGVNAMFTHVANSAGSPLFGIADVGKDHQPALSPRQALDLLWPRVRFILSREDGPGPAKGRSVAQEHWHLVMFLITQHFIRETKKVLDPKFGVPLVMEAAIAMSKVDPKTVPQV